MVGTLSMELVLTVMTWLCLQKSQRTHIPPWSLRTSIKTPVRQICDNVLFALRNVRSTLNLKWLEWGESGQDPSTVFCVLQLQCWNTGTSGGHGAGTRLPAPPWAASGQNTVAMSTCQSQSPHLTVGCSRLGGLICKEHFPSSLVISMF